MTTGKLAIAQKLLRDGIPVRDVAMSLSVSVPTLYRWLPAESFSREPEHSREQQ